MLVLLNLLKNFLTISYYVRCGVVVSVSRLKYAFILSGVIMVLLIFLTPDIDYDSYFRFQVAYNMGFSLLYAQSLIWLPGYQFIVAVVKDFVLMRFFSVVCVLATSKVLENFTFIDRKVAVATSLFYLFNPFIILYGSQAMSESLSTLLMASFIYLFVAEKHIYAALVLVCGVLTTYSFWVLTPFVLVFGLARRRKSVAAYLLPVLAIVWWGHINYSLANSPLNFLDLASLFHHDISATLFITLNPINVFLFPLVYPLMFTLPFTLQLLRKNVTRMNDSAKSLLLYFIILTTILLMTGQILGYLFGWGRYFIPLLPVYIMLGCEGALRSKHKRVWIVLYLASAIVMTVIQAQEAYNFKLGMTQR